MRQHACNNVEALPTSEVNINSLINNGSEVQNTYSIAQRSVLSRQHQA